MKALREYLGFIITVCVLAIGGTLWIVDRIDAKGVAVKMEVQSKIEADKGDIVSMIREIDGRHMKALERIEQGQSRLDDKLDRYARYHRLTDRGRGDPR